jgi:hypothetical protein
MCLIGLFKRAKEVDHPAVAVTDHGTMTALFDAWEASFALLNKSYVSFIPSSGEPNSVWLCNDTKGPFDIISALPNVSYWFMF